MTPRHAVHPSVRSCRGALLALVLLLCSLIPAQAAHSSQRGQAEADRWRSRLLRINEELQQHHWQRAEDDILNLLQDIADTLVTGGNQIIGNTVLLHAVALEAQDEHRKALWQAQVADIFHPPSGGLLSAYGLPGHDLLEALRELDSGPTAVVNDGLGLLALYPSDLEVGSEVSQSGPLAIVGDVVPPKRISGREPDYPEGVRLRRGEDVIIVEVIIDRAGRLNTPKVLRWSAYPTLILSTLKAIGTWRFRPATLHGKPVAVHYTLTINFKLR